MKHFKQYLVVLLLVSMLAACSPASTPTPEPTATPVPIPAEFKMQLNDFLKSGSKVIALSDQGVTFTELRTNVADVKGAYDLLTSTWPDNLAKDSLVEFEGAFKAWSLTLDLWNLKIDQRDEPVEPNINGYKNFVAFGGDRLIYDTHPKDFIVKDYRGKKFVTFKSIGVLLSIATDAFQSGKQKVLNSFP